MKILEVDVSTDHKKWGSAYDHDYLKDEKTEAWRIVFTKI
jgi:hypothetical protein